MNTNDEQVIPSPKLRPLTIFSIVIGAILLFLTIMSVNGSNTGEEAPAPAPAPDAAPPPGYVKPPIEDNTYVYHQPPPDSSYNPAPGSAVHNYNLKDPNSNSYIYVSPDDSSDVEYVRYMGMLDGKYIIAVKNTNGEGVASCAAPCGIVYSSSFINGRMTDPVEVSTRGTMAGSIMEDIAAGNLKVYVKNGN